MTRIEYLVAHPYEVEKSDIPLLKKEVEKYPYFYTLRALLLYGLKKENHPSFEDYLNKTSIQSSNRVDLYHYINSEPIKKETETIPLIIEDEKVEELVENKINSEVSSDESTAKIVEQNNDTTEVTDENIEENREQFVNNTEIISKDNSDNFNEDIVDEMIENYTEESELRTDHVVDIISEDELNEVAEITNEVVEISTSKEDKTSINDIANAVQQTSEIELIENNSVKNEVEILAETIEVIEESKPEVNDQKVEIGENNNSESTFSFTDWLKKVPSQSKTKKEIEEEQEIAEREIKYKLIDDFLEKNPKIVPMKKTDITPANTPSNFVQNTEEYSDLMTETLAQIYIEQKKYDKAIKAYKILILKYPEKNSLFANRIKEIENLKNSK
ncbi:hypothetical protein OBK20_10075 [Empedobacter falsenii]|uniref:tetratricopeptide repeat protein n=1 Tax=Empedobacter stercoris TaxID=1628248 RepID=UPI0016627134|nr:tetratricopeptide repeat protein [Empedobacter stercoris]MCA4810427.1 hypothetical protein [Empedobacter stercoris]QNT13358.1 hypothetical protein HNV03_00955 [Empedobacter stercoris]HJD86784.1 hypothetical protein [Empedobacter falsenii]